MTPTSTSAKKPGWLKRNWLPISLISLIALVLGGFVYFASTQVSGMEINIQTLAIRKFEFRRDPFTNAQLTGIRHSAPGWMPSWKIGTNLSTIDGNISKHLDQTLAPRWDLVDFDATYPVGEAKVLLMLLSAQNTSFNDYWIKWTTDNPKKAALFWPEVQQLALNNRYARMPGLFEIARLDYLSLPAFKQNISSYVQESVGSSSNSQNQSNTKDAEIDSSDNAEDLF